MRLMTDSQRDRLVENGRRPDVDHSPVVKLFMPGSGATWLLSMVDPRDTSVAFGLCDLGFGFPEMGSVSLIELAGGRGAMGLGVERDLYFEAHYPLSVYAEAARALGAVTTADRALDLAAVRLGVELVR